MQTDLKVWTGDTFRQLPEERLHNFDKLGGLDYIQDLLKLIEEHHLLWAVGLRPVLQKSHDHLLKFQSKDASLKIRGAIKTTPRRKLMYRNRKGIKLAEMRC